MTTDYKHPEYNAFQPLWQRTRDACAGQEAVKARGEKYLPNPEEGSDDPVAAAARYERYKMRATYFNASGRTLAGLVGVAFANWPQVKTQFRVLLDDADGSGIGLINQAQGTLSDVLQTGRAGLLADWTRGDDVERRAEMTVAEFEASGRRPFIVRYEAEQILTWERIGSAVSRVVLLETEESYKGGEVEFLPRLRELALEDGKYVVRIWVKYSTTGKFQLTDTIRLKLNFIPFAFVGAINNDTQPDRPPLLDLADLNLAHYRNSADFEESAFLMGQPQLVVIGATDEWRQATGAIKFGARKAIVAPHGGGIDLLQVQPNTLAQEAMRDKETKMQALGARLMAANEAVKTATQSAAETKSAYSTLSLACDNVSAAYTRVLQWVESWGNGGKSDAYFAIDTRFNDLTLDANAIRETVAAWQAGLVPQSDAVAVLQRLGVIDQGKTAEQVADEVESQGPSLNLDEAA